MGDDNTYNLYLNPTIVIIYSSIERCVCRNGRLFCSRIRCPSQSTSNDDCESCRLLRVNKVCGPNGVTYINNCTAVNCAGFSSEDLLDGPCSSIVSKLR